MEYRTLGRSGLSVSRLCFGTLTLGPLQAGLPLDSGAAILARAIELGVNFADTAQLYRTYPYIKRAMQLTGKRDLIISSKTYAYTAELARQAVEEALRGIDRDYIDIFMLHEQESIHTLRGHMEAAEYLLECKARGTIRAVGVSTHRVAAVTAATELGIFDLIHPIFNVNGIGIADGSPSDMENAVSAARASGMGVLAMKALGGGHLYREASRALGYVLDKPYIDSIAVGMQSVSEVEGNIALFNGGTLPEPENRPRRLHIESWCEGCGECIRVCRQNALDMQAGTASVDHNKCIRCGYCGAACSQMAIKML